MRVVAVIAATRPDTLPGMLGTLADCDQIHLKMDFDRVGHCAIRNELLARVQPGDIVRLCDDDDYAFNSAFLASRMEPDADVLAFSYFVNHAPVIVRADPLAAAINTIISCNWMIRAEALRRVAPLFDPAWTRDTGTRAWLRMMDAGLRFQFEPGLFGYFYRRGVCHDAITRTVRSDCAFFAELERRITDAGREELLDDLDNRMRFSGATPPPRTFTTEETIMVPIAIAPAPGVLC